MSMLAAAARGCVGVASFSLGRGGLLYQSLRFVRREGGRERWWQPILPALAPELAPFQEGRGNKQKRMMQRKQQMISMHARRKEGAARNHVIRHQRAAETRRKVKEVYEKFAALLAKQAQS